MKCLIHIDSRVICDFRFVVQFFLWTITLEKRRENSWKNAAILVKVKLNTQTLKPSLKNSHFAPKKLDFLELNTFSVFSYWGRVTHVKRPIFFRGRTELADPRHGKKMLVDVGCWMVVTQVIVGFFIPGYPGDPWNPIWRLPYFFTMGWWKTTNYIVVFFLEERRGVCPSWESTYGINPRET